VIIEVRYGERVQRMTYEDFERRIREGEIGEDTPVRFPLVTGDAFQPAGGLELYQALADPEAVAFRQNLARAGLPLATAVIVGLQVRLYLLSWQPEAGDWLQEHLTNWAPAVLEEGRVWRVLSYGLLHLQFTHLLFNLLFIAYTGYHLERAMGARNLLVLFFGSVLTGGLMSLALSAGLPVLGSSGGGFGLLAAAVIFGWKHWESIPAAARKYFGFAILPYPAISILTSIQAEKVDNWAHLGGLLGGALLMTLLEPEVFSVRRARNRVVRWVSLGLAAATLVLLYLLGPRLESLTPVVDDGATFLRPASWQEGGVFTGERGWRSPTGRASLVTAVDVGERVGTEAAAVDAWLQVLSVGSRDLTLKDRQPVQVDGVLGERVRATLSLDGVPYVVDGLVLTRGVYTYRAQMMTEADRIERLRPLVERVFAGVSISDPPTIAAAREAVARNPRSWGPQLALATVLAQAGDAQGALAALDAAAGIAPQEPEVIATRLDIVSQLFPAQVQQEVQRALDVAPRESKVIVAAARALASVHAEPAAFELLDRAWADMPGDRAIRKQRRAWGLSVELPKSP